MKKAICIALALICTLALGIHLGYSQAIKDAYLIDADDNVYHIEFNGEVHEYDYE